MPNQISPPVIDSSANYSSVRNDVAALLQSEHEGLEISLTGSAFAHNELLAMSDGLLHFTPAGSDPARLVLQLAPAIPPVIRDQTPQGIPALEQIVYIDVDQAEVKSAIRNVIANTGTPVLQQIFRAAGNSVSTPNLQAEVLKIFMHEVSLPSGFTPKLPVKTGTHIGAAVTPVANRAVFTLQMLDAGSNKITPEVYIQSLPKIDGKARYTDHPLITQMTGAEPQETEIFLRLEIYDLTQNRHVPIPNVPVSVIEPGTFTNDTLKTATTLSDGTVPFTFPANDSLTGKSFFFEADLTSLGNFAGHSNIPAKWSTAGWLATDESTKGEQTNFQGFRIGANGAPAVFRVGVDVHVQVVRYETDNDFNNKTNPVPIYPGTTVQLQTGNSSVETDVKNGVAHGVTFDMEGGDRLTVKAYAKINQPKLYAVAGRYAPGGGVGVPAHFQVFVYTSEHAEASLEQTSIGTHGSPVVLNPPNKYENTALFELKTLLELINFLDEITGGSSTALRRSAVGGDQPMVITHNIIDTLNIAAGGKVRPFAFPKGFIHLIQHSLSSANSIANQRETIFHESTHQVTYFEANLSQLLIGPGAFMISEVANVTIGWENDVRNFLGFDAIEPYNFGNHLVHNEDYLTNPRGTLIEAYPEFMAQILNYDWGGTTANPDPPININRNSILEVREGGGFTPDPNERLGPLPPGSPNHGPSGNGINVEGAVVNALFHIFIYEVIDPVIRIRNFTPPMLPQTPDGDVVAHDPNNWITNNQIQARFQRMLWKPMTDLEQQSGPVSMRTVKDLMERGNPADWHRMLRWLHCWNIHMQGPGIDNVSLTAGAWNTPHTLTLQGSNFVFDQTVISLTEQANPAATVAASAVRITSSTEIEIDLQPRPARDTLNIECVVNQQTSPHLATPPPTYEVGSDVISFTYT